LGAGLDGSIASNVLDLSLDLSELIDMTATMVGTDEFVVLDGISQRRKSANEISLSIFNDDLTYDNYGNWFLYVNNSFAQTISSSNIVDLNAGTNVTISHTGNDVTISATDTDTTYSNGDGIDLVSTIFSHANTSPLGGATEIRYSLTGSTIFDALTIDRFGHITAYETRDLVLSDLGYTGATDADNYSSWTISDGTTSEGITSGAQLNIVGTGATTATYTTANNTLVVNSSDTNTTYSAGSGIDLSGTTFSVAAGGGLTQTATGLEHTDTSTQASVNNSGTTVIQDVTLDTYGHVTALGSTTLTIPADTDINAAQDTATTALYPVMVGASGSAQTAKVTTTKLSFNASTGELTATSYDTSSDINLKKNIQKLENASEKLKQISGYSFDFIDNGKSSIGVIAQEIEKVFPELVHGEEGSKAVAYGNLVALLIETNKDLLKRIEDLEKKI